jgi:periplasmic protein TonB
MRSPLIVLCLLLACQSETPVPAGSAPPPPAPRAQYPLDRIPTAANPGDPIRNPEVPPRLLTSVEPVYSGEARRRGISGIVVLEIVIESDGRVSAGRVLKPLPFGLPQAAIDAVGKWRYSPAIDRGRPVRALQQVTVKFGPEVVK